MEQRTASLDPEMLERLEDEVDQLRVQLIEQEHRAIPILPRFFVERQT